MMLKEFNNSTALGDGGFAVFRKSDWLKIRGFDEKKDVSMGAKI